MDKILIWDLDGTIIDSMGIFEDVLARILPSYNIAVPAHEVVVKNYHGKLEETIDAVLGGIDDELLALVVQDFLQHQDTEYEIIQPHIFPDVLRLVERAHAIGYKQILVTNRAHEGRLRASPRSIIANSDLKKYIDVIICGDDSEHRKPKPEVLGSMLNEIKDTEVLVIGDQHVDVEFAKNLNASGVLICRDGSEPPHMDGLTDWKEYTTVLQSLDEVKL